MSQIWFARVSCKISVNLFALASSLNLEETQQPEIANMNYVGASLERIYTTSQMFEVSKIKTHIQQEFKVTVNHL